MKNTKVTYNLGIGFFLSGFVSYVLNGFLWSVLHAFFGWFYLIYVLIFRHSEIIPAFKTFFGI